MMTPAFKTLQKIDHMMRADQGASFRQWLGKVLPHIGDAYRADNFPFRAHLGASLIGRECAREIWYGFRWSVPSSFDGRLLRLFNRGHLEEGRFIALLLMIGCEIWQSDENGKQYRISDCDGYFGGSGDGIGRGLPDLQPDQFFLCEFKTHNKKSFEKLTEKGVKVAKPEHWYQMQVYMRKMGIPVALYMAVCKDDDALHAELIASDPDSADSMIERAHKIVWLSQPPAKLSESKSFYKCKFCTYNKICHDNKAPHKNCRTCKHVSQTGNGVWHCNANNCDLTDENQLQGCQYYDRLF